MILATFALSLGLTLAVELAVLLLWRLHRRRWNIALCALVNILTNPAVVLVHMLFPFPWVTLAAEAAAVTVEALYYRRYGEGIDHPWRFSLTANAASFLCGLLIQPFI